MDLYVITSTERSIPAAQQRQTFDRERDDQQPSERRSAKFSTCGNAIIVLSAYRISILGEHQNEKNDFATPLTSLFVGNARITLELLMNSPVYLKMLSLIVGYRGRDLVSDHCTF